MSLKNWLPPLRAWWPPKEWRLLLALLGSIGGGGVSTALAWRVMTYLAREDGWRKGLPLEAQLQVVLFQLDSLKTMAMGLLILMGLSIVGLWFVLGRRAIEISAGNFKASAGGGGDEEEEESPIVRTTTETQVVKPNS